MIDGIPRISVLVITYRQENLIGRTLDSLLIQKDYLYEICVSDDCSPDNTWGVLQDYHKRYPDIIKLHRNNPNVGIFKNIECTWTMPTGDVINQIAGDDTTPDGWYKTVVEYILNSNIDYKNELFCIYGDYKAVYPSGDSIVFKQNAIQKKPNDALRLALRGIICGRGCCYSINVLKKFDKVSQGQSHKVEHIQDRQLQINAENNYYISYVANIYYSGIGVSANINEETYKERLAIWPYTIEYLTSKGLKLCKVDVNYGRFNVAIRKFQHNKTLVGFLRLIMTFVSSRDLRLPVGNRFRHLVFSIRRRLPHKYSINFI